MNRIYDISLELDILCPESDSRKLVRKSLVKKSFKLNISLNMQKIIFHNIFSESRVHLIMHFILKLHKLLYPAFKHITVVPHVQNTLFLAKVRAL